MEPAGLLHEDGIERADGQMAVVTALQGSADVTLRDGALHLPDAFAVPFAGGLVVTVWVDGCIALWPRDAWESLASRLTRLPISDSNARAFGRLLFSSAMSVGAGVRRLRLPDRHRAMAGIRSDAVLVGAGDHAELWSRERWAETSGRPLDEFLAGVPA